MYVCMCVLDGVEFKYEGDEIGEKEGVIATKNLLLNAAKRLN